MAETPVTPSAQPAWAATAGKVRWRRFAILLIPSAAVAAVLVGLTATGSVAASISVSGNAFEVTSTQLRGTGFEQFGSIATQANCPAACSASRSRSPPGTVVTVLLTLLNSLTPLVPVTMTNVTTDDFLVASDSLQANDLDITSGA
jgi:hypothetical protein